MSVLAPDSSQIARQLAPIPGVRLALLFGSVVAGRTRPESDIDVAVWLEPRAMTNRYTVMRELLGALSRVLPASRIDLVILNDAGPHLAAEVARKGRVVYEGRQDEFRRFRMHVAACLQDTDVRRRMVRPIRMKRLRQEAPNGRSGDILAQARSLARLFA